jgi:SecD/SecF fusion protein
MTENVGRKLLLIFGLLGLAVGLLLFKSPPFRLGLDLKGGTRYVYSFDFEDAIKKGLISANEDPRAIMAQQQTIIGTRADPQGVMELLVRQEGSNRLVVEVPGLLGASASSRPGKLGKAISATENRIELDANDTTLIDSFPANGGVVTIERERVRYAQRDQATLYVEARGYMKTPADAHAAGTEIKLFSDDAIRNAIENLGELGFSIVANNSDLSGKGTDLAAEQKRMTDWAAKNPGVALSVFNRLPREEGGPHPSIRWYPNRERGLAPGVKPSPESERADPLLQPAKPDWNFTGQDLSDAHGSQDDLGFPAVAFAFKTERSVAFGDFTSNYVERQMAILLNGEIATAPKINGPLPGRGIIEGRFSIEEVNDLVTVLRSGSLKIKPQLEHMERVGPTLGADNIARNVWAGVLAFFVVCGSMIAYYRLLGVFASISLMCNALMMLGGMAFMDATLTLPGIGGIILTIGMALDANILIFDRIREESESGKSIKQAAKDGFDRAFTAIFDGNITTLIAGFILYQVGSGPVRGFAVTLCIGIMTTLFCQLVISRVLVHYALERGVKQFKMGRWLADANFQFMSRARTCMIGSAVVILAGVGLFLSMPNKQKLGIEFLGGGTVMIRTEQAMTREDVRTAVSKIEGDIGGSEVKAVAESELGAGTYTAFRITFKTDSDADESAQVNGFESTVRQGLAGILQRGPVEIETFDPNATPPKAEIRLTFEGAHSEADVLSRLGEVALLSEPKVVRDAERPAMQHVSATLKSIPDQATLRVAIENAFPSSAKDSVGNPYVLASPIAESAVVGKQVVGELTNKAILAILLSMFAILIYVRVRFAEYSFGWGAIVAVIHDVLIALVACAVAIKLDFVPAEINVTMISVFLTIIGYSINDTIVIFDRVRENLPRLKKPLREVLDISINETLSRTILTSTTTFLSVSIMLAFNFGTGNALEGFCYAMLAGMISGVYSTIYIASPVVLWWEERSARRKAQHDAAEAIALKQG